MHQALFHQPQRFVAAAAIGEEQLTHGFGIAALAGLEIGFEIHRQRAQDQFGLVEPPRGDTQRRGRALFALALQVDGDIEGFAALFLAAQVVVGSVGTGDAQAQWRPIPKVRS